MIRSARNKPGCLQQILLTLTAVNLLATAPTVSAAEALIAVAANFAVMTRRLADDFERNSGHQLKITVGSTGKLYAQVVNGAPFDVLLAADQLRPQLLETHGLAVTSSRFTYARGVLCLWSPRPGVVDPRDGAATLRTGSFNKLAMANPALAPYGQAATDTLQHLQLEEVVARRIVMGENIAQAHVMVATGNADLGFVALSYLINPTNPTPGSHWVVPESYHTAIVQDAVLLRHGDGNDAAIEFLSYLRSEAARALISAAGYRTN